jgi:hypothetical protein
LSGFTVEWLDLREPADSAARASSVVECIRRVPGEPMRIIDLATGTGANFRYLAPRLGGRQDWLLVDHDVALLAVLLVRAASFLGRMRPMVLDLATSLDDLPFDRCELVTASALLDLVSESWLSRLVQRCAAAHATALFALTYNGWVEWSPSEPEDEWVRELLNQHQRGDKGFGAALGPAAAAMAANLFASCGYDIEQTPSDWHVGHTEPALQVAFVRDWVRAAAEIAPNHLRELEDWGRRRATHIDAGVSTLRVGHTDLVAWPR